MKEFLREILSVGPLILYAGAVVLVVYWLRWRRKTRWPFKDNDRLLRMPGESLKREALKLEESFVGEFFGGAVASLVALPASYHLLKWAGRSDSTAITLAAVACLIALGGSAFRIGRLSIKRSDYHMGWFGERLVADRLRPLQAEGYRVFHDVPCEGAAGTFNIDHVTVGPTGVAVIETKTKRKPKSATGDATQKEHEVIFDGSKLKWSNGVASDGPIKQVSDAARWLADWIHEQTGIRVSAKRVLTVPGWMVYEKPKTFDPDLRVIPPQFLKDAIKGRTKSGLLTDDQIDLIARQLETKCRDVQD